VSAVAPLWALIRAQEVPAPGALGSPLPGGLARAVRFFLDFPQPLQIAGVALGAVLAIAVALVLWRRRADVRSWLTTRPPVFHAWLGGAVVLLSVVGASAGVWGWRYVQHDNGFCTGCHVMGPAFVRFTESEHSRLECHDCHRQPMMASMRQLYLWVTERPEEIGPHSPVPTQVCAECHVRDDPGETWEAVATTQGHATHLESDVAALSEVQCVTCHGREVHRFVPAEETCAMSGCHRVEDTRVTLGAMSGAQTTFHCLGCHEYTAPPRDGAVAPGGMVPGAAACAGCHAMETLMAELTPASDPHGAVCGACHDPHTQTRPADAFETCVTSGCHSDPLAGSPFHRGLATGVVEACGTCHSAHAWVVDGSDCRSCHARPLD